MSRFKIFPSDIAKALMQEAEQKKRAVGNTKPAKMGIANADQQAKTNAQIVTAQGPRPHMQDCVLATTIPLTRSVSDEVLNTALENTAIQLSAAINQMPAAELAGSTATVVVVLPDGRIGVLQLGDSIAIKANRNGEYQRLNRIHHPRYAHDKGRIQWGNEKIVRTGSGNILYSPTQEKQYMLAVSRVFGDTEMQKTGVNSEPDLYHSSLSKTKDTDGDNTPPDYLLLYTDGLNEVMTDQAIVDYLKTHSIEELRAHAYALGCTDNTAIIYLPMQQPMCPSNEAIVLGVFDGHDIHEMHQASPPNNGAHIAEYLALQFPDVLQQQMHTAILPEFETAIQIAANANQIALKNKLITLRATLLENLPSTTASLSADHPYRKLAKDTQDLLTQVFLTRQTYAEKITGVLTFRNQILDSTFYETLSHSYTLIDTLIGAIIGLVLGAIIGALCTPGFFGIGGIPGAVAGAIEGATMGSAITGVLFNRASKPLYHMMLKNQQPKCTVKAMLENTMDAITQHYRGEQFRTVKA